MKKIIIVLLLMIFAATSVILVVKIYDSKETVKSHKPFINMKEEINKHYNNIVIVNKDATLYDKNEENIGTISKETIINLNELEITDETKFFSITNTEYFVKHEDVDKYLGEVENNNRYKNYIPFNENIITKDSTKFYNEDFKVELTINKSFNLPIIIKESDYYGVEYNNKLYYINKDDVETINKNNNSSAEKASKILTLAYHYIYNPETRKCTQVICNSKSQVETHFKYLNDNNYLSITLKKLEMFFDKKIELPKKVIAVTIDDGYIDDVTYELLEKHKIYATLFVITGRFADLKEFNSPYLTLESHTNNMHNSGECKGYRLQGGGILCKSDEYILNDLKTSQDKIGKSTYFAYPFYDWNDRAIKLLKSAGFTMAFVGQRSTNGYASRNVDKFKVPRKTILSTTTEKKFIELFS